MTDIPDLTEARIQKAMEGAVVTWRILVVHVDVLAVFSHSAGPTMKWVTRDDGSAYEFDAPESATTVSAGLNAAMTHKGKPLGYTLVVPYANDLGEFMKTERAKLPKTKEDEVAEFFGSLFGSKLS